MRGSARGASRRAILGLITAILCGTLVALSTHVSLLTAARTDAARLTQVTATILEPAAPEHGRPAIGHWTTPAGERRTGIIPAPPERGTGMRHDIWIDEAGRISPPPKSPLHRGTQTALAGTAVTAAIILLTSRRQRQIDDIDAAWRRIAPAWTRRYR